MENESSNQKENNSEKSINENNENKQPEIDEANNLNNISSVRNNIIINFFNSLHLTIKN